MSVNSYSQLTADEARKLVSERRGRDFASYNQSVLDRINKAIYQVAHAGRQSVIIENAHVTALDPSPLESEGIAAIINAIRSLRERGFEVTFDVDQSWNVGIHWTIPL